MKVKTPSKHTSLKLLKAIQADYYRGVNGQEYCKQEVDELIWKKQSEQDQREVLKLEKIADRMYIGVIGR